VAPEEFTDAFRCEGDPSSLKRLSIIECDGDRSRGRERPAADEAREKNLQQRGYAVLRFKYSCYEAKPRSIGAPRPGSVVSRVGGIAAAGWPDVAPRPSRRQVPLLLGRHCRVRAPHGM